jgi:hypothetical protein
MRVVRALFLTVAVIFTTLRPMGGIELTEATTSSYAVPGAGFGP